MRRKNTELLSEIIRQMLKDQHLEKPLYEKRIIDAWTSVLGPQIEKYTSHLEIKNAILYVSINSAVLRHDLFLSREGIKNALNKEVGHEVINSIVFR
jgi:predicted nucleic acid-binding Zn ribbon protein